MKRVLLVLSAVVALALAGCDAATGPDDEQEKRPPEPLEPEAKVFDIGFDVMSNRGRATYDTTAGDDTRWRIDFRYGVNIAQLTDSSTVTAYARLEDGAYSPLPRTMLVPPRNDTLRVAYTHQEGKAVVSGRISGVNAGRDPSIPYERLVVQVRFYVSEDGEASLASELGQSHLWEGAS